MNNQPVLSVSRKIANFIPSYHHFPETLWRSVLKGVCVCVCINIFIAFTKNGKTPLRCDEKNLQKREKLMLGERGGRKRFPINQDYSKMLGCHGNCSGRVSQPHLWLQGSSVNAKALQTPQTCTQNSPVKIFPVQASALISTA